MTETERAAIVAEAKSWLGTPYHHAARVKGAGCDCIQLLVAAVAAVGLEAPGKIVHGEYPQHWHLHRHDELYLDELRAAGWVETETPQPGDIAMFRFGRTVSHGALVLAWPRVIHAYSGVGVIESAADEDVLKGRFHSFWTPGAEVKETCSAAASVSAPLGESAEGAVGGS